VAPQNTLFPIHPRLTGLVIAYRNEGFIAEEVSPRFKVDTESFKWYKVDPSNTFNQENDTIGNNGDFNEVRDFGEEESSSTKDRGLAKIIPNKKQGTDIPYQKQQRAAEFLVAKVALNREKRVATQLTTAANYTNNVTISTSTEKFDDYTNSRPILRMRKALDVTIIRPNIVILPRQVATVLRSHPEAITGVTNDSRQENGVVSIQGLADLLEVERVLIAGPRINTANKGQSASYDRIWGNHVAMIYIDPAIDPVEGGVTFAATAEFESRVARTAMLEDKGLRGSMKVMVGESLVEILPSNGLAGYLIRDVLT
jgi:hypothetical protein